MCSETEYSFYVIPLVALKEILSQFCSFRNMCRMDKCDVEEKIMFIK